MDKYRVMGLLIEDIPNFIDNTILNLFLLEYKICICKCDNSIKFSSSNSFFLMELLLNFHEFSQNTRTYLIKKLFNKINKNALYGLLIRETCNMITYNIFDYLDRLLKSFIEIGLLKMQL